MTKKCTRCGVYKPLADFYKHKQMRDGHLGACKECVRLAVKTYRDANVDRVRAYDRERGQDPARKERVRNNAWRYRRTDSHQKMMEKCPEKRLANIAVGNAIRKGTLLIQPCEVCGKTHGVHAHHDDYSRPLDVRWLCPTHHGEVHRRLNEEKRARESLTCTIEERKD